MPKRQKAKLPSAKSTTREPSTRKLIRIAIQEGQEAANDIRRANRQVTPWHIVKDKRRNERRKKGLHEKWRKANASSIGQKPTASNTLY